jgi:hypothetical protein
MTPQHPNKRTCPMTPQHPNKRTCPMTSQHPNKRTYPMTPQHPNKRTYPMTPHRPNSRQINVSLHVRVVFAVLKGVVLRPVVTLMVVQKPRSVETGCASPIHAIPLSARTITIAETVNVFAPVARFDVALNRCAEMGCASMIHALK